MTANASPKTADVVPLQAHLADDTPGSDGLPDQPKRPPHCRVSGKVQPGRKIMLRLDQDQGALFQVFGDRRDATRDVVEGESTPPFSAMIVEALCGVALGNLPPEMDGDLPAAPVNALIQAVGAFEATNELEGMIAAQAVALHAVTMDSLVRAARSERADFRHQYMSAANKSARTFAALIETLNRHRGKTTTQRVIVENVTVEAGGQAVVGAVAGAGAGANKSGVIQSHANTERSVGGAGHCAPRAALPGADAERKALPASGREGPEALPDARGRGRDRRAEGQQESLGARPLQRRGDRSAADHANAAAKRGASAQRSERVSQ